MAGSSDDASEISDSELEVHSEKTYLMLKSGKHRLRNHDGTLRCPFCAGKKKQGFLLKDLHQHATGVAVSNARRGHLKASHLALARYLEIDLAFSAVTPAPTAPSPINDVELYVWPWMGIVINAKLNQLRMFTPVEILPLADQVSTVLMFSKDMKGYRDAMNFEIYFKRIHAGKGDWKGEGPSMRGWVAREDDYNGEGAVGEALRLRGDLRTYSDVAKDPLKEAGKKVGMLAGQIATKNKALEDMESRCMEATMSLRRAMAHKEQLQQAYNEEMRNMQLNARDNARRIFQENERLRSELDSRHKELEYRSKQLEKLETQNETEKMEVDVAKDKAALEKSSLQMATMMQKKADAEVLRLVENQKREKEIAIAKILRLERQLDQKQQLELELEQLKGKSRVMKHLGEEDVADMQKMEELKEKLEEEKDHLEDLNSTLISKERKSNDELQEARKKLITGLDDMLTGKTIIGIKRMGELDEKPFQAACKERFKGGEADIKAAELISFWQEELKNPAWHPFKIIECDGDAKEIIDEKDEKLQRLSAELGGNVYNAVKTALLEMNEYNPSGRYTVPELWNFRENRRAAMKDGVQYVLKQWMIHKRKK